MKINTETGFPSIRRARGYRLYGYNNQRYLDFYQEGGRAILGHRQNRLSLVLKDTLQKGVLAAYPGPELLRLEKACRRLFPDYEAFRFFANEERRRLALQAAGFSEKPAEPLLGEQGCISLWRPFSGGRAEADLLLPVLPFPGGAGPAVAAFRSSGECSVIENDPVSPVLAAGLSRAVHNLLACKPVEDSFWSDFECSLWRRKGPYLIFNKLKDYGSLFDEFKNQGILLPPKQSPFALAPHEWNDGELGALKKYRS